MRLDHFGPPRVTDGSPRTPHPSTKEAPSYLTDPSVSPAPGSICRASCHRPYTPRKRLHIDTTRTGVVPPHTRPSAPKNLHSSEHTLVLTTSPRTHTLPPCRRPHRKGFNPPPRSPTGVSVTPTPVVAPQGPSPGVQYKVGLPFTYNIQRVTATVTNVREIRSLHTLTHPCPHYVPLSEKVPVVREGKNGEGRPMS